MRALHVITGLGIGGAEQQLRLLLRHLPVSCDVVTLTNPGPVAAGLRADGVRVTHLGMTGNRDLTAVPRLAGLIRREKYDLVHTHLYRACVYGRIAARLSGTVRATVATEHSLGRAEIEGRPLTRATRALYLGTERLGAATVAVSTTVAGRLRDWGVPASRIHLVPNGIDADAFRFDTGRRRAARALLDIPEDAFVAGGVGRLVPGKRFDVLVRAVAALPGVWLLLAGDGPESGPLRALAGRLGVTDRIRFLGECDSVDLDSGERGSGRRGTGNAVSRPVGRPGIPALLCAMDAFVSASREESFGLAVVEALASGLPVLHSACPAIEDLPPGQAPGATRIGLTRPAGATETADPAVELTAALRRLVRDGVHRLPPPPAVAHYDIRRSSQRLMDVYTHAIDTAPSTERAHS